MKRLISLAVLFVFVTPLAVADEHASAGGDDAKLPDASAEGEKKDESFWNKDRNWFAVPIPVSNPTFGTGLVLGGAYFYPQTEAQKKAQPASVTGAAGFYSDNDSSAFLVGHQTFLKDDKWRIGGVAGVVDLRLELRSSESGGASIDWIIEGEGFYAQTTRVIGKKWRAGILARYLDFDEQFSVNLQNVDFNLEANTISSGLGAVAEYDNRETPFNPYTGNRFEFGVLANSRSLGGDDSYESYDANYSSYHSVHPSVVLAWEVKACYRSDGTPLWDACYINLRGFSFTEYIGQASAATQAEARWRFHGKWGAVAFVGGGYYSNSFNDLRDREIIPSYGVGLRYMVLPSKRINLRLDYGRSNDNDAIYLSVMEAF